jgi:hypothetical protein
VKSLGVTQNVSLEAEREPFLRPRRNGEGGGAAAKIKINRM